MRRMPYFPGVALFLLSVVFIVVILATAPDSWGKWLMVALMAVEGLLGAGMILMTWRANCCREEALQALEGLKKTVNAIRDDAAEK